MSDESMASECSEITDIEEEDETASEVEYQSAGQCMYGNEPEYPTSHSSSESESDIDESDDDLNSSRLENPMERNRASISSSRSERATVSLT